MSNSNRCGQTILSAVCFGACVYVPAALALDVEKFESGNQGNRVQIGIIGDGYTSAELENLYAPTVASLLDYMLEHPTKNTPYPRYRNFLNFYRIDVESEESGVDIPEEGIYVNTALAGERGCTDWRVAQLCNVDWNITHDTFDSAEAEFGFSTDWYLVLLNDDTFNGAAHYPARGALAVYSAQYQSLPNDSDIRDIALHEGGHAWHGLADEYVTQADVTYAGAEPSEANVTADATGAKWAQWLGYQMPSGLEVEVIEGALYVGNGAYRPSRSSKMNGGVDICHSLENDCGHNMPSIEKIVLDIYDHVRPIDSHTPNAATLINPDQLQVDVVDSEVIMVDWSVDGVVVSTKAAESFNPADYIDTAGDYVVTARAWDEVIQHAFSDNLNPHELDLVRRDLDKLEQSVSWNISIEVADTDGDGVADDIDAFPNDPLEISDTDGDGVGDNADAFPDDPALTTIPEDVTDEGDTDGSDTDGSDPDGSDPDGSESDQAETTTQNSDSTTSEGGGSFGIDLAALALLLIAAFRKKGIGYRSAALVVSNED